MKFFNSLTNCTVATKIKDPNDRKPDKDATFPMGNGQEEVAVEDVDWIQKFMYPFSLGLGPVRP